MPNFFQAIGQSNLQDTMQNLTNTALNIRQMQNQEQHMRAIEAHQDQALELQRQNTEAERLKAQEYKKQQELIDIDNELGGIGFTSPEEIAYFKKKAGLHVENVGGRDYIQRGVGTKLFMDAAKDPQSNIEVGTIRIGNLDKQIAQLETAMAGGEEHGVGGSGNNSNTQGNKPAMKLKPEQVQQLGVQLQQLREQRTQLVNNMKIEQRKIDAQLKEKRYLPNSPNGLFDTETQQVVAGTQKPEEEWSPPFEIKVGDKTIMAQKNEKGKYSSIGPTPPMERLTTRRSNRQSPTFSVTDPTMPQRLPGGRETLNLPITSTKHSGLLTIPSLRCWQGPLARTILCGVIRWI